MSGHTEGPWIVGHPYSWYGNGIIPIGLTHKLADGRVTKQIAAIQRGKKRTGKIAWSEEDRANARLIAASPVMLAALRGLMGEAEDRVADASLAQRHHISIYGEMDEAVSIERARWQAVIDAVYLATGEVP